MVGLDDTKKQLPEMSSSSCFCVLGISYSICSLTIFAAPLAEDLNSVIL